MRISTAQFFEASAAKYQNNFTSIVKTQEQVTSGVRIQTAADDPVGAAKLLLLQQQQDMLGQYSGNMSTLKSTLANEESVLDSVNTALQRARELALSAGNGAQTDADRKTIANELGEIEEQVLGLLNSKDANGQYLFSGSKTSTPPYALNSNGTYTYQGDENQLSLQVSETLSLASNDTAKSIMEGTSNAGRTQATWQAREPAQVPPEVNDGKVSISAGLLTSSSAYNKAFGDGQTYRVEFVSSTEYKVISSKDGDITSTLPGNGVFDSTKEGGSTITLGGVKFDINVKLSDTDTDANAVLAGRTFSLEAKPDSFDISRTPSNASTAQLTGATVTDAAAYASTFPGNGAVIKFTSATEYEMYAQPLTADSKAIGTGSLVATVPPVTPAGLTFQVSGTPQAGDQFAVGASNQKASSALDTLSQLRKALLIPADGDAAAQLKIKDAVNAAVSNLASASEQVDNVRGSIGARLNSIEIQSAENVSQGLANKSTISAIADTDLATASIDLAFQQSLLQASQLAFVKISQLSLFNKL